MRRRIGIYNRVWDDEYFSHIKSRRRSYAISRNASSRHNDTYGCSKVGIRGTLRAIVSAVKSRTLGVYNK